MEFEKRVEICFKGNDIRGLYKEELDENLVYNIGKSIVEFFSSKKLIVGNDIRFSSPSLKNALIRGITEKGSKVIDIGMIDTPGLYFATGFLNLPGISITASHNPIEYNGIKIVGEKAVPVGMGTGLEKIKELVLKNKFTVAKNKGVITEKDILQDYKKHVLSFIDTKELKNLKVVVDAGNSIAGKIVPLIYDNLSINLIKMYFEITGYFEHHEANPLKEENVKDLKERVVKEKADLGIAFDGDMDRIFFIDEKGIQLESSYIAALVINNYLKEIKRFGFVYSLTMSKIIPEIAEKNKVKAFREKVGHSFIKTRMKKEKAFYGCEDSGHFYYEKNYYADSGIITSLIVLEIFSKAREKDPKIKFSELFHEFKKYAKLKEQSFKIKDKESYEIILSHFKKQNPKNIETLDGLTFFFGNYWFNIRFSQTEPVLRFNMEADNETILNKKSEEITSFLTKL